MARTFTGDQNTIAASPKKNIKWAIKVVDTAGSPVTHYWSTTNFSFGGDAYTFKVIKKSFTGVTLNRAKSELGIQAPNDVSFVIDNSDDALNKDDFDDAVVTIYEIMNDGTIADTVMRTFTFITKKVEEDYNLIKFTCKDYLQRYTDGVWPNEKYVKDAFPATDPVFDKVQDKTCFPIPFGTAYIPLRSVYINADTDRYYALGPSARTYYINEVRSPREVAIQSRYKGLIWIASGSGTDEYYAVDAVTGGDPKFTTKPQRMFLGGTESTEGAAGSLSVSEWDYADNDALGFSTVYVRLSDGTDPDTKGQNYVSVDFAFPQSTKTDFYSNSQKVFQPIIYDTDDDLIADSAGFWESGSSLLDMPTKFSRDDTRHITGNSTGTHTGAGDAAVLTDGNRTGLEAWVTDALVGSFVINKTDGSYGLITANTSNTVTATLAGGTDDDWDNTDSYVIGGFISVIKWILSNTTYGYGIPESMMDTSTWGQTELLLSGWNDADYGLKFNGGYWYQRPRQEILAELLTMCNCYLVSVEKIEIHSYTGVKAANSVATLTSADILKRTFKTSRLTQKNSDSGTVAFPVADDSQDRLISYTVPAFLTYDYISNVTINAQFLYGYSDAVKHAQFAASLSFQRRFDVHSTLTFQTKGTAIKIDPDDTIYINDSLYGGPYYVRVDKVKFNYDGSLSVTASKMINNGSDWTDLGFSNVTPGDYNNTTSSAYKVVIAGADGLTSEGGSQNVLPGRIWLGDQAILLDPIGKRIAINEITFGNQGIQLEYNSGNPRAYIGDGADQFFQYDGTNISWNTPTTSMDAAGKLTTTSAEIGGWDIAALTISADSGSFTLNSSTPALLMGTASDYLTGVGVFMGKNSGVYKLHMGDPVGDHMYFDGSNLYVSGVIITGAEVASTIANTFTINSDLDDVNTQLILGRTTGGNATLQWDGISGSWDKDFNFSGNLGIKGTNSNFNLYVASNTGIGVQSSGVDGTFVDILSSVYTGNSNEQNAIQTSVSVTAENSGFNFMLSDGGGSPNQTQAYRMSRATHRFYVGGAERVVISDSSLAVTGTITATAIIPGTDNAVLVYDGTNILTDEIDPRVWGSSLVDYTGTPLINQVAVFTDTNTLQSAADFIFDGDILMVGTSGGIRLEMNATEDRFSVFDAVNEKIVMGYLTGLQRNNAVGTSTSVTASTCTDTGQDWTASELVGLTLTYTTGAAVGQSKTVSGNTDTVITVTGSFAPAPSNGDNYKVIYPSNNYGFWAFAGDTLTIDGDMIYENGDWIVENDASLRLHDGSGNEILRFGTDTGEKGLFIYEAGGAQLAKYTSDEIFVGDANAYLHYTQGSGLLISINDIAGLTITGSGGILVDKGGDIILEGDDSDWAEFKWVNSGDNSHGFRMLMTDTEDHYKMEHFGSPTSSSLTIGGTGAGDSAITDSLTVYMDAITMYSNFSVSATIFSQTSTFSMGFWNGGGYDVYLLAPTAFSFSITNTVDMGTNSLKFKDAYFAGSGIFGDIATTANITSGTSLSVGTTFYAPNIGIGTDNTVLVLTGSGFVRTDEIDVRVWGSSLVDGSGSSTRVAYWSDGDTLTSASDFTFNGNSLYLPNMTAGVDNSVVILDSDGYLKTDEIDSRVWGSSLVDGAGSNLRVAYWTDSNTLSSDANFLWGGSGLSIVGTLTVSSLIFAPNIGADTDNSVVILNGSGLLKTDEIDSRVWGSSLVDASGTPANNQLAVFTDANTVDSSALLTWDGSSLTVDGTVMVSGSENKDFLYDGRLLRFNTDDTSNSLVSGGNATNSGANISMFGGSHATLSNVFRIRQDGTTVFYIKNGGDTYIQATAKFHFDGGNDTYMIESSADNLQTYVGGNLMMSVSSTRVSFAGVYTNDITAGTIRDVAITNLGQLGYSTSTIRAKTNIVPQGKSDWLYLIDVVEFEYKNDLGRKVTGLTAENLELFKPELVWYDPFDENDKAIDMAIIGAEGSVPLDAIWKPVGIDYKGFVPVMIRELQDHESRLQETERKIIELEEELSQYRKAA